MKQRARCERIHPPARRGLPTVPRSQPATAARGLDRRLVRCRLGGGGKLGEGGPVRRRLGEGGFTLVEVMIAAIVLILAITTAITTLQRGFQALDTARNTTYASQVMQSELERLRLKSWVQMQALQDSKETAVETTGVLGSSGSFRCTRTIRDLKTDMKEITLQAQWSGYDGRPHALRYITRYGKSGLYDYFYTAH